MKKIREIFRMLHLLLILPGIHWNDEAFSKDLARWKAILHIEESDRAALAQILSTTPEFRNLLIYRNSHRSLYRRWIAFWYRPMDTLYIETPQIGGGLYIQHGFATMIAAKSIGENCWINQQVTIGYSGHGDPPVIGNNVMITCGAKVLGNITVGDHAVIGANAVVIRDVEAGAKMGGVPAHRIDHKEHGDEQSN
ncbi:MAG: serine O-acetyltransferase [Blautia sp.]